MDSYAIFIEDVRNEEGEIVFKKGKRYYVASEDKEMSLYFIQIKRRTNIVAEFPASLEGVLFDIEE